METSIKNMQQFFQSIRHETEIVSIDTQSQKVRISNITTGFFPPAKVANKILSIAKEDSIVRSRALVMDADEDGPDVPLAVPKLKQGEDGISGKFQMAWFGEDDMPDVDAEFEETLFVPHEVGGIITVSDRLLNNVSSENYFDQIITDVVIESEDEAFLVGSGLERPHGVIHCPGRIDVDRAAANTVSFTDAVNMFSKLLPQSIKKAVWVASQSIATDITTMVDAGNNSVYKDGKILNIPVEFTEATPIKGQRGDLMLCDFRYYGIKDGTGLRITISDVANFRQNKSQMRVIKNVDGHGIVAAPLKLKNGNYASPFVVLK